MSVMEKGRKGEKEIMNKKMSIKKKKKRIQ